MTEGFEPGKCWRCALPYPRNFSFWWICNHWPRKCKIQYQSLDGDIKTIEYSSPTLKDV